MEEKREIIRNLVHNRKVLFISTKNKDYIRNRQEIRMLKESAGAYEEIVFSDKSYIKRIVKVWLACFTGKWKRADVIFAGFAPQLVWPFLKRWTNKKEVVIDFFISMFDTCVNDRKYFKERSAAAWMLHKWDEITLRWCHCVIADTQADKRYFSEEFRIPPDKIQVMYLEADTDVYSPEKYKIELENSDKISVLYFGSILPLQGIEVILKAVNLLREYDNIQFTIVGPVKLKPAHSKRADASHVRFIDWLSQEELAGEIARANLCLAGHFNAEIEKAKRTIPGKAYIYEAMHKPMILGENPANRELFQEDEKHFFVEMGNAQALADMIVMISEKRMTRKGNGRDE